MIDLETAARRVLEMLDYHSIRVFMGFDSTSEDDAYLRIADLRAALEQPQQPECRCCEAGTLSCGTRWYTDDCAIHGPGSAPQPTIPLEVERDGPEPSDPVLHRNRDLYQELIKAINDLVPLTDSLMTRLFAADRRARSEAAYSEQWRREHDRAERAIALVRRFVIYPHIGSLSFQSVEPVEVGCYDCEKARADARAFLREIDGGTPEEKS